MQAGCVQCETENKMWIGVTEILQIAILIPCTGNLIITIQIQTFVFGFTLGGSWKGIDVNAMFQGVGKQYVIRNDWMAYPFQTRTANQNPTYLGKTWTESNPNAEFPRLTTNANLARWNYQNNDFMMQNNRYIRLKTLIVGYTLPQIWTRKVKLEKVRVYFSGNDLWEATSIRDGFDPAMCSRLLMFSNGYSGYSAS